MLWGAGSGSPMGNNFFSAITGGGTVDSPYFMSVLVLSPFGKQGNLSSGGNSGGANNGTPTTPVIQQANGKFKPNVPPEWGFCGKYRDGSGGGSALYQICMNTPNSPWGNCVRGTLLNQYTPNPNPPELFVYLFVDHPVDFASCLGK